MGIQRSDTWYTYSSPTGLDPLDGSWMTNHRHSSIWFSVFVSCESIWYWPQSHFYCSVIAIYPYFSLDGHRPINAMWFDAKWVLFSGWNSEYFDLTWRLTSEFLQTNMCLLQPWVVAQHSRRIWVKILCMGLKKTEYALSAIHVREKSKLKCEAAK